MTNLPQKPQVFWQFLFAQVTYWEVSSQAPRVLAKSQLSSMSWHTKNKQQQQKHVDFMFYDQGWIKWFLPQVVGQLSPSIVHKMLKLWDFALSLIKA